MSDTDSFIDEVTEEVRRDKLFATMRKYGWIAVLVVVAIVGGTAWREYSQVRTETQAQAFGDAIMAALEETEPDARIAALDEIATDRPGARAVLDMLVAAEKGAEGDDAAAVAQLQAVAGSTEVPQIYRQIARYKALARGAGVLSLEERRRGLEDLAVPGEPLRLLAEEQLALVDIEAGNKDAALERLKNIAVDSEATAGLRRRASQLIVALGGSLDDLMGQVQDS
ncbi:tetratricopeptide repeat protein [Primorskyibacter sp. 2E107]|uniref:tetratricopeptide repeat protein n=1 Tax=Primorskyibacter sp. 2E107 TaxID=3403458 RepID=UPI003AF8C8E7